MVYEIDEDLPCHSTISRIRALYGEDVFQSMFQKFFHCVFKKGLVVGKRQAMDSAYIKVNASMDSLVQHKILEDEAEYLNMRMYLMNSFNMNL